MAAGHVDGSDGVSFSVHLVDYVSGLKGDGFESKVVFAGEIVKTVRLQKAYIRDEVDRNI